MTQDEKDEIRVMILKEIASAVEDSIRAVHRATGTPPSPPPGQISSTKAILDVVQDKLRHAEADVIAKTDPQRADVYRRLKAEF